LNIGIIKARSNLFINHQNKGYKTIIRGHESEISQSTSIFCNSHCLFLLCDQVGSINCDGYYSIHSFIYHVIEKLKEIFEPPIIDINRLSIEDEEDAFNKDQDETKLNNSINTMGLLNEVKKKMYIALCYYYLGLAPQELLSALLDS
ncbi:7709_t:CDS:1, partial [Dentiscutata heterogama]